MICNNCHQEIPAGQTTCPHCGTAVGAQPQQVPAAPSQVGGGAPAINQTPYLIWSILVTLFCCLPLGIGSIIYATKINSAQAAGDYAGAQDAAKKCKMFSIIGAVAGGIFEIIYIILVFAGTFVLGSY